MSKKIEKSKSRFCLNCQKRVSAKEKTGIFRALRGILMFFSGIAPGKRESQLLRCPVCNTELPED